MNRAAAALLVSGALAACNPAYNWREVRIEPGGLKAMLPCKPDKGVRTVPMAGRTVSLEARGCDAGGATFAVLSADVGAPEHAGEALAQWQAAALANIRGTAANASPFLPPGASGLPQSLQVVATGQRPDGSKVESQAAYFARGSWVFQAVIYAGQLRPELTETFFSALQFQ